MITYIVQGECLASQHKQQYLMAIYACPGLCVHAAFNPLYILILILIVANNVQSF